MGSGGFGELTVGLQVGTGVGELGRSDATEKYQRPVPHCLPGGFVMVSGGHIFPRHLVSLSQPSGISHCSAYRNEGDM